MIRLSQDLINHFDLERGVSTACCWSSPGDVEDDDEDHH